MGILLLDLFSDDFDVLRREVVQHDNISSSLDLRMKKERNEYSLDGLLVGSGFYLDLGAESADVSGLVNTVSDRTSCPNVVV